MNPTSLNANLDFRRAAAHLVDRDAIAAVAGDYIEPLPSYVDTFSPTLSQHAWDRYPYDPDKARELIDGVKDDEGVDTITAVYNTTGIHDVFDPEEPPPDGSKYYRRGTGDSSVRDGYTQRFAEVRDLMNATVDDEELKALIAEAEDILADQMVILPLYGRLTVGAVRADEIANFVMIPTRASHARNIEQWYRADLQRTSCMPDHAVTW